MHVFMCVMAHIWMHVWCSGTHLNMCLCVWCYGTHLNASWHTCDWVMANMRGSDCKDINESWHTCMQWDQNIKDESWRTWLSHGPHESVMAHISESWHTCMEWDQHIKDVRRFQMCHGTQIKVSWHSDDWVMANNWMAYGTHGVWHTWRTIEWSMAHLSLGEQLNGVWHTRFSEQLNGVWHTQTIEWSVAHANNWMEYGTLEQLNGVWHTCTESVKHAKHLGSFECVMAQIYVRCGTRIIKSC